MKCAAAIACLAANGAGLFTSCTKQAIVEEAYAFGYPLVTMDLTRRQETNVQVPDDAHAPMGQLIKLRAYPAVDNHNAAAPNADTLYTMVSRGRGWCPRGRRAVSDRDPRASSRERSNPRTPARMFCNSTLTAIIVMMKGTLIP